MTTSRVLNKGVCRGAQPFCQGSGGVPQTQTIISGRVGGKRDIGPESFLGPRYAACFFERLRRDFVGMGIGSF